MDINRGDYIEANYIFPISILRENKEDNKKMPVNEIDWSKIKFEIPSFNMGGLIKTIPEIKQVIFNNPATIIMWKDGTKTIVKIHNEGFDEEKGFAMAYLKKVFGGRSKYMKYIKNATRQEKKESL